MNMDEDREASKIEK